MRRLNFTVSLEQFTSRIPGIVPAFDSDGIYHVFTKDAIVSRQNRYPNNYGMIPINVDIHDFFETNPETTIKEGSLSYKGNCVVSYRRLDDWYFFFTQYYDLLNNHGSCGRAYKSAVDYYDNEMNSKRNDKLIFGNSRRQYEDMDSFFVSHGGKVIIKDNNNIYGYDTEERNIPSAAVDEGLFKYLLENIFLKIYIPKEYRNAWGTNYLWFGDAIKWNSWFDKNRTFYGYQRDVTDCNSSNNCCECEEYYRRGGNIMADLLSEWVNKVNEKAIKLAEMYENNPSLNPISVHSFNIQQSIENMGEMSIFSNDWEPGINYANTQSDTKEGTVVIYNNNAYLIRSKEKISSTTQNQERGNNHQGELFGFKFDEKYLEKKWGNDKVNLWNGTHFTSDDSSQDNHWKDYTSYYVLSNPNDFKVKYKFILKDYKGNYKKIYSDNKNDAEEICDKLNSNKYLYDTEKCAVINNVIYPVIKSRYITIDDKNYLVEKEDNKEYIIINSSKNYILNNMINNNPTLDGELINFKGEFIVCNNNIVTLKDGNIKYTYQIFDAHCIISNNDIYIKDNKIYNISNTFNGDVDTGFVQLIDDITISITNENDYKKVLIEDDGIIVVHKYELENATYVTGYTESKLSLLLPPVRYYDDIGNEMHGYNPIKSIYWDGSESMTDNNGVDPLYSQPTEGTLLKPYYNIGNTTSITSLRGDKYNSSIKFYNGNIITDMVFYCTNNNGDIISANYSDNDSLEAINQLLTEVGDITEDKHIKCDITYHIDATLVKDRDVYKLTSDYSQGVRYEETVEFVKKQEFFNISTSSKILVWYYDIQHMTEIIKSDIYNQEWDSSRARFSIPYIEIGNANNFIDMDANNNTVVLPLFREEFRFGNSAPQNVKSDIYIDRGINYAFDKHLKLGEISSFEALENYSNEYFNIIDS